MAARNEPSCVRSKPVVAAVAGVDVEHCHVRSRSGRHPDQPVFPIPGRDLFNIGSRGATPADGWFLVLKARKYRKPPPRHPSRVLDDSHHRGALMTVTCCFARAISVYSHRRLNSGKGVEPAMNWNPGLSVSSITATFENSDPCALWAVRQ